MQIRDRRGWQDAYDLDRSLVAIVGPIDRGKTSMVDCIGYLLGHATKFRGAVDGNLRAVRAQMRIGNGTYVLHRKRSRASKVEILDQSGTVVGHFPMKSKGDQPSLSDWLLEQLGLDDAFAAVRLKSGKSLNFAADLLPYLHIRQDDIDRFVIRPASKSEGRLAVLNLLFQLRSPTLDRLSATINDLDSEIRRLLNKTRDLANFLAGSESTNAEALEAELLQLQAEEEEATNRQRRLDNDMCAATPFAEHLRRDLEAAAKRLDGAEDGKERARRRHRNAQQTVDALDESINALATPAANYTDIQSQLELRYTACTACGANLQQRIVPPGHCSMCVLPLPDTAHEHERAHLASAKNAAVQQLAQAQHDLDSAKKAFRVADDSYENARSRLHALTAEAVSPFVSDRAAASGDLAAIKAKIHTLRRLQDPHLRLEERYKDIARMEEELESKRTEERQMLAELQRPEDVIESLDALFLGIVKAFQLPWATGRARLDNQTFLPMVDEQDFDQRGGGSRTAVSVAYSLALLMNALQDPTRFYLPTMLILDSPQKNLGRNETDHKLATRIYTWIIDYIKIRRAVVGRREYDDFQLIVVDNNIPAAVRGFKIHRFEDDGFIRGLTDPHGKPAQPPRQLEL